MTDGAYPSIAPESAGTVGGVIEQLQELDAEMAIEPVRVKLDRDGDTAELALFPCGRTPSLLQVAEAMYQVGKLGPGPKMPDALHELSAPAQNRYLLLARAALSVTGKPPAAEQKDTKEETG